MDSVSHVSHLVSLPASVTRKQKNQVYYSTPTNVGIILLLASSFPSLILLEGRVCEMSLNGKESSAFWALTENHVVGSFLELLEMKLEVQKCQLGAWETMINSVFFIIYSKEFMAN